MEGKEGRKMSRRKFLTGAGAGLALAGAGYLLSRESPFERLYGELSDFLDDNPVGEIGETYEGKDKRVVLAIRQYHKTSFHKDVQASLVKMREMIESRFEVFEKVEDAATKERLAGEVMVLSQQMKEGIEYFTEVGESQREIYKVLNHLARTRRGDVVIGTEGLWWGEVEDIQVIKGVTFDAEGNPQRAGLDEALLFYYDHAVSLLKKAYGERVRMFGLEERAVHKEAVDLLRQGKMDTPRFRELQGMRNRYAVTNISRAMERTSSEWAGLIYGSEHFEEMRPTIQHYLREAGLSYVEFIPATVKRERVK